MNLPPESSSSEELEQATVRHSVEETPVQPSFVADVPSEEVTELPPTDSSAKDSSTEETIELLPTHTASEDSSTEETTELPPTHTASEDIPTLPATSSSAEPLAEPLESPLASSTEAQTEETELPIASPEMPEGEFSTEDEEDEDEDEDAELSSLSQPSQSGVFVHKGWLIGVVSAVVVVALLASLLVFVSRPKDPPTDWIATYTPPAGASSSGKVLYYLHWTNQNGELTGQLQLAANPTGTLQSLTVPATGLYNKDNHIIYVVITINGQADTLTGKVNDANDTLNLNPAGVTSQSSLLVFHIGTANDYKLATKKLGAKKA